jgi:hypothetical protein
MKRCKSIQGSTIRISFAVKQELRDAGMSAVRSHMKRGKIVDGDLVHRGFVVKKNAGCVNMVSLKQ